MKNIINLLFLFTLTLILSGCYEELTTTNSDLVVEGWIEDDGFPVVSLTSTIPISNEYQSIDSIGNYVIKWAKVTVSDNDTTVILTGKIDQDYFPNYIYTTSWLRGHSGKSYKLTVDYNNFHATATTYIPKRVSIDSFSIKKCINSDTLYQINAFFKNPIRDNNFYKIFTKRLNKDRNYYSSLLGTFSDAALDTMPSIPILRSNSILTTEKYSPYFSLNDNVIIKFVQLDENSYEFWHDFESSISLSRNYFIPYVKNIHSNIIGALGYWCGYGANLYNINIKEIALKHK